MKIKLSVVTLIACIALLAGNAVTGFSYLQKEGEHESAVSELDSTRNDLTEYEGNSSRSEAQLTAAEVLLYEEELALEETMTSVKQAYSPDKLSSGGILSGILKLAESSNVGVIEVSTQPEGDEESGILTFTALYIDLQVTGELPHLAAFVTKLEKGAVKSVTVDEIVIEGDGDSYTAELHFTVTYPRS